MQLRLGPRRRSPRLQALGGGPDLISTLPDDLLLLVLARLECAAAAARTGVLSRRWRGLWARLSRIVLRDLPFYSLEPALARLPPPPAISLLEICLPEPSGPISEEDLADSAEVNSLLRAAAQIDPEEFFLVFPSGLVDCCLVLDLPCFHRATSIVLKLDLSNFGDYSTILAGVEFPALQSLSLSCCTADFGALLSCCPRLRTLRLADVCFYKGAFRVNSPFLQELVVVAGAWINQATIVAPVLKQLTMSLHTYQELTISILAPTVENVSWDCRFSGHSIAFGLWRLAQLSLQAAAEMPPSLHIHACISWPIFQGEVENFTHEIDKHMIAEFSILELHLDTWGHVFGALAFLLLGMNRIRSSMRRLKVLLQRSMPEDVCPQDCPCEPTDWRSQTISLTALEEVEISGFEGNEHEIDFLKLIFKCSPLLRRITVKLSHEA
ncbi:uncharacterized protein LOC124695320 [Lolium rigidum]|uniref:uncharacterized protein LOC124695320 n=1 Tax=Lolium rigidum TaxID=89674 RepID=UPI001F5DFB15|nr:uncharacterized protein LOC124695320 [Lolium rigidum]